MLNGYERRALSIAICSLLAIKSAYAESFDVNHVHRTASIFMDTTEMHTVSLDVQADGIYIHAPSWAMRCDLPGQIPVHNISLVQVDDATNRYMGGGRITRLRLELIDDKGSKSTYTFVSSTARRLSSYEAATTNEGREWKEGADRGQTIRSLGRAIEAITTAYNQTAHHSDNRVAAAESAALAETPRPTLAIQSGHSASVDALAFSPDQRWLISAGHDFSVILWDHHTGREIRVLGKHTREVNALAVCPNSQCVVSASNDRTIKVWQLPTGQLLHTIVGHESSVRCLAISSDGKWLISGAGDPPRFENRKADYSVRVWNLSTGEEVRRFGGWNRGGSNQIVASVALSPDNNLLAAGTFDGRIAVWNLHTGKLLNEIRGFQGEVRAQFLSDNRHLVAVSAGGIRIIDGFTGEPYQELSAMPRPYIMALCTSGNALRTIAYPVGETIEVLDGKSGNELFRLERNSDKRGEMVIAESVAVSQDNNSLAAGYSDGAIVVWDLRLHKMESLSGYASEIRSVAFSPDGRWLASGNASASIALWDITLGELADTLPSKNRWIDTIAFSSDGHWLAASGRGLSPSEDTPVELWDLSRREKLLSFSHPGGKVEFLTFSPNGKELASAASNGTVIIWDISTQRKICSISTANKVVAIDKNNRWVATGSRNETLTYWSIPEGRILKQIPNVGWAWEISNDDHWLASAGWRNEFKVFDLSRANERPRSEGNRGIVLDLRLPGQREQRTFRGHRDFVSDLVFSSDGRMVASSSWDGQVKLWDVASGREVHSLLGHNSGVESIAFSHDDRYLASGSMDGTVRIWDVNLGTELVTLISSNTSMEWLVVAPNGLFDGKADAMNHVAWHSNAIDRDELVPLGDFFNDFYYPGILTDVLNGKRPGVSVDVGSLLQIPGLRTMLRDHRHELQLKRVNNAAYVCFRDKPTAYNTVNVDASLCPYGLRLPGSGDPDELIAALSRSDGELHDPWYGRRAEDTSRSTLHILTIGIGHYSQFAQLDDLPASVSAANSIEEFFETQRDLNTGVFGAIRIWKTPRLRNEAATLDAIREEFNVMSAAMKKDDIVFLFLSGHGQVMEDDEMFYFDPFDSSGASAGERQSTGLSTAMLAEALREMPARRIVIIMDACQSGGILDSLAALGRFKAENELRRSISEPSEERASGSEEVPVGIYVIAATSPVENGGQDPEVSATPVATALLEALRGGAGNRHGKIWMTDVVEHISERVPTLSRAGGKGLAYLPFTSTVGVDFPIALAP